MGNRFPRDVTAPGDYQRPSHYAAAGYETPSERQLAVMLSKEKSEKRTLRDTIRWLLALQVGIVQPVQASRWAAANWQAFPESEVDEAIAEFQKVRDA